MVASEVKRRLNSAPLTDEDVDIWFFLAAFGRDSESAAWIRRMLRDDRRDADLMFQMMTARTVHLIIETERGPDFFLWVFHAGDSLHRWTPMESQL